MNKNGWGLRVELAFILLFLICILISTILLHRMNIFGTRDEVNYSDTSGEYNYSSLESQVVNAAKRYYADKYNNYSTDTIITLILMGKHKKASRK